MSDDDLRRRLEKLVALRDHPSTLPAIREEARRAEERIRRRYPDEPREVGLDFRVNHFQRLKQTHDPAWDNICDVLNRETRKIWPKVKPAYPHSYARRVSED